MAQVKIPEGTQVVYPEGKLEPKYVPVDDNFELPFKRVLNNHIIVLIDAFQYSGRILIPDKAKRQPTKGKVIAIADNIKDIEIGDRILYSQFAGYALVFQGIPTMRVLGYEEVLAVLKDETPDLVSEGA